MARAATGLRPVMLCRDRRPGCPIRTCFRARRGNRDKESDRRTLIDYGKIAYRCTGPRHRRSRYRRSRARDLAPGHRGNMDETGNMPPRTLFEKIWDSHVVAAPE